MRKIGLLVGTVVLLLGQQARAAELKEYDAAIGELIDALKEGAKILKDIRDQDSAEAAKPQLKKLGDRFRDLAKKFKQLGPPTKDQDEELKKNHRKEIQAAQTEFRKQRDRVEKVPGGKEALKELERKP